MAEPSSGPRRLRSIPVTYFFRATATYVRGRCLIPSQRWPPTTWLRRLAPRRTYALCVAIERLHNFLLCNTPTRNGGPYLVYGGRTGGELYTSAVPVLHMRERVSALIPLIRQLRDDDPPDRVRPHRTYHEPVPLRCGRTRPRCAKWLLRYVAPPVLSFAGTSGRRDDVNGPDLVRLMPTPRSSCRVDGSAGMPFAPPYRSPGKVGHPSYSPFRDLRKGNANALGSPRVVEPFNIGPTMAGSSAAVRLRTGRTSSRSRMGARNLDRFIVDIRTPGIYESSPLSSGHFAVYAEVHLTGGKS